MTLVHMYVTMIFLQYIQLLHPLPTKHYITCIFQYPPQAVLKQPECNIYIYLICNFSCSDDPLLALRFQHRALVFHCTFIVVASPAGALLHPSVSMLPTSCRVHHNRFPPVARVLLVQLYQQGLITVCQAGCWRPHTHGTSPATVVCKHAQPPVCAIQAVRGTAGHPSIHTTKSPCCHHIKAVIEH